MAMKISFMILVFVFVFGGVEITVKAIEANIEKYIPKYCFKGEISLVCIGFKTLSEINLKWKNCPE